MAKKRKISGLTGTETVRALSALDDLLDKLNVANEAIVGEMPNKESEAQEGEELVLDVEGVRERVQSLRDELAVQKDGPLHFSFSDPSVTGRSLADWKIVPKPKLVLRRDFGQLVARSKAQGSNNYMSSTDLRRHLRMLDDMVPMGNEASARLRIDAVFFRAYALIKPSHMVLSVEHRVQPTLVASAPRSTPVSGFLGYTAFVTPQAEAHLQMLEGGGSLAVAGSKATGIFVAEANTSMSVGDNIPQVVMEMYSLAKQYNQKITRGALSTGEEWMFIILYLNDAQEGGYYRKSLMLGRDITGEFDSDLVAGIVAHWMQHGFEDLGPDDWFEFSETHKDENNTA